MRTAEKIYSASTSEKAANARLPEKLARRIEDDIVSSNLRAGGVMGSLRQLSERYSVGRAAAREAVALLERRRLGRLRPGPCGGFVVAEPAVEAIGSELADYFRMIAINRAQLMDAREAVDLMCARLAARGTVQEPAALPSPAMATTALEWQLMIRAALADLGGEPVLSLFVASLNLLTADFARPDSSDFDWRTRARRQAAAIERALRAGDAEAIVAEAERLHGDLGALLRDEDDLPPSPTIDTARHADDRTLATLVARRLAAEIQRGGTAGQRLGSEWDLCERLSVSRATLRQAIRLLQDRGFVECRRGRGNGLVVRDLRGTGSIRLVLAFLIGRQMDPKAAGTILFQLNRFVPALAVSRADREQRAGLKSLLTRIEARDSIDRYDLLRLVQTVSQLSDSPIIDLFSRCLTAFEARFHPSLREVLPARMQADYFKLLGRLLDPSQAEGDDRLAWAKRQSSDVLMDMSRTRPI